jgi:hypothetical protein
MMLSDVVIEAETPGDCRTTFRLCVLEASSLRA